MFGSNSYVYGHVAKCIYTDRKRKRISAYSKEKKMILLCLLKLPHFVCVDFVTNEEAKSTIDLVVVVVVYGRGRGGRDGGAGGRGGSLEGPVLAKR